MTMPLPLDLIEFGQLPPDAPFPAKMEGAGVDADTGMAAMMINERTFSDGDRMPVDDLCVREEDGHLVLETDGELSVIPRQNVGCEEAGSMSDVRGPGRLEF